MTQRSNSPASDLLGQLFDDSEDSADEASREQLVAALLSSQQIAAGLRTVFESSPVGLCLVQGGKFQYVNPAFVELFGYRSRRELEGQSPRTLIKAADLPKLIPFFGPGAGKRGGKVKVTFRGQRADGSEVLCEARGAAIEIGGRRTMVGTMLDVSDRVAIEREREQLLQEAQDRLRRATALKDAASVFAATLDVDQVLGSLAEMLCAAANATSAYICSYDAQQKRSICLAEYYGPEATAQERVSGLGEVYDLEVAFPGTAELLETGDPVVTQVSDLELGELERAHMEKFGAQTALLIPIRVGGQITSYAELWASRAAREFSASEIDLCQAIAQQAAIAIESGRLYEQAQRELEQRVQAQEALRQSEQRYRAVAESAFTGIVIADAENRLTYVNPAFAELLKYQVQDLQGRLLSELLDDDQWQIVLEQTEMRMQGQRSQYELTLNRRDGEKRQVLISASPALDSDGNYQAGIGVATDITELKAAQDALSVAIVRMEDALERAREMASTEEALRDTISSLGESLNLDEVLDRILENVGKVVPHDTADIMLLEGSGDDRELRVARGRGYRERRIEKWLLSQRLPWKEMQNFRRMERTGRPVAVSDTRSFPGWMSLPETEWIRSYAGAPLRHKGRTIGFLNLNSEHTGAYRQVHAENLQVFANQAAVAIENARLFSQAQDEIAERRRVERALRSSETRYRNVFEGVQDAIVVGSLDGEVLEVNDSACKLFSWTRQGTLGANLAGLLPEVEPMINVARLEPKMLPNQPIEFDYQRGEGDQFPIELRIHRHRLDEQDVLLVVGRDITDRKLADDAQREVVRMKVQFVLSASHSLRTPLHTLMGFLELINSGKVRDPERQADFLRRAAEDANRIYQLISELMDAARIEVGEQGLQSEPVRAAELVARIVEARKELATGSGVELALEPVSAEVVIQADRRRLGAAIDAVLHNAIRYSPSGSQVQLRVTQTDRQVEFEIRDQGPGIPPADLQALTGASSLRGQHGSGSLRASSGPGLGLYLANNIVRAHGGQLEIHSRVGQGTTVFLRLPS